MINIFFALHLLFTPRPLTQDFSVALAEARIESDLDPTATECPAYTEHRHHDSPEHASNAHPCFCGLWQTTAVSPAECRAQRDPELGLSTRNLQFGLWSTYCRSQRSGIRDADLTHCIIAGYATGVAGAREALGLSHSPSGHAGTRYANYLLWSAARVRARFLIAEKGFLVCSRTGV